MTDRKTNNFFNRKAHAAKTALANLVSRFVLEKADDGKKMQEVKGELFKDEVKDELEHFQNYGFTSVPPADSEGIALSMNGNRDHVVIICTDSRQYRKKGLEEGECAVYNGKGNNYILLKNDGSIEIKCTRLKIDASIDVEFTGQGTSVVEIRDTYNTHTHNETQTVTNTPNQTI